MKKKRNSQSDPDLNPEYDFSHGVRGRYVQRLATGSNVVVLDPDVARVFTTSKMVNDALRGLARSEGENQPRKER